MKVYLEASQNGSKPKRIMLLGDAVIGRSTDCNLRIASRAVSRMHCRIQLQNGIVALKDLGSSNGTRLNGSRIKSKQQQNINDGDKITIGPMNFVLRVEQLLQVEPGATQPMSALSAADLAETMIDAPAIEVEPAPTSKAADRIDEDGDTIDENDDFEIELSGEDDEETTDDSSDLGKTIAAATGLAGVSLAATVIDTDEADSDETLEEEEELELAADDLSLIHI